MLALSTVFPLDVSNCPFFSRAEYNRRIVHLFHTKPNTKANCSDVIIFCGEWLRGKIVREEFRKRHHFPFVEAEKSASLTPLSPHESNGHATDSSHKTSVRNSDGRISSTGFLPMLLLLICFNFLFL